MDDPTDRVTIYRSAVHAHCMERHVVLQMAGIPSEVVQAGRLFEILVDSGDANSATGELAQYEEENRAWVPEPTPPPDLSSGWAGAAVYSAVLILIFSLQQYPSPAPDWWSAGVANAGLLRQGEWWRAVTALTLHADVLHVVGNLALGALFGLLASRRFGAGLAWCGIVLAGTLGNAINAIVQTATHTSIGASTAVFGALGILAAHTWRTKARRGERAVYRWAPVVSGAVLLSLLGTAGERTDVVAHVTGFGSGALLGAMFGSLRRRWLERPRFQLALGVIALGLPAMAWISAL